MSPSKMTPDLIYKIFTLEAWQMRGGLFEGSDHDRQDGFIHFSTAAQLQETLDKHYGAEDEVVVGEFSSAELGADLKWETSRGGASFPHLYAPLDLALLKRQWQILRISSELKIPADLEAPHA